MLRKLKQNDYGDEDGCVREYQYQRYLLMAQQALEHRDNNGFSSEESDYNDDDKDQNNDGNGLVMESGYEQQNALKCIYSSRKNAEHHCSKQKGWLQ